MAETRERARKPVKAKESRSISTALLPFVKDNDKDSKVIAEVCRCLGFSSLLLFDSNNLRTTLRRNNPVRSVSEIVLLLL